MTSIALQIFTECLTNGLGLYKQKQYQQAIKTYQQAAVVAKQTLIGNYYSYARALRGIAYIQLSKYQQALTDFNQVLDIDKLNTVALIRRARVYINLKKFALALQDLDKALELEPDNVQIQQLMKELEQQLNELKESEKNKYSLKKKLSAVLYKQDQQILLNFSNLKQIDKSIRKTKSVMFNQNNRVHEIEPESKPQIIEKPIINVQEIIKIEAYENIELNPLILHKSLTQIQQNLPKFVFKRLDSKSILRQSKEVKNDIITLPTKRLSVLSVKDIDGKMIQKCLNKSKEKQLSFGFVQDLEKRNPEKELGDRPLLLLKKKSSLKNPKKNSSFIESPKKTINIDGKYISKSHELIEDQLLLKDHIPPIKSKIQANLGKFSQLVRKQSILKRQPSGTDNKSKHSVMFQGVK